MLKISKDGGVDNAGAKSVIPKDRTYHMPHHTEIVLSCIKKLKVTAYFNLKWKVKNKNNMCWHGQCTRVNMVQDQDSIHNKGKAMVRTYMNFRI